MSIFKKASELNNMPSSINQALFDDSNSFDTVDEFEGLIAEASSNRGVYEDRLKNFRVAQDTKKEAHQFTKPQPARYADMPGGIRRVGEGKRFEDENSELFGSQEKIRNISYDNNKYAENLLTNGFSIWEAEFDELQNAFETSQKQSDNVFDRRTFADKKAAAHAEWEKQQSANVRQSNVLPYRGLGISRLANDQPLKHDNFGSVNDFYAQAHDDIRELVRQSNEDRKSKITRQGYDPQERRDQWENKEAIAARTMKSLENSSFLAKFAEGIKLDD